jgi:hypothetical protein
MLELVDVGGLENRAVFIVIVECFNRDVRGESRCSLVIWSALVLSD